MLENMDLVLPSPALGSGKENKRKRTALVSAPGVQQCGFPLYTPKGTFFLRNAGVGMTGDAGGTARWCAGASCSRASP